MQHGVFACNIGAGASVAGRVMGRQSDVWSHEINTKHWPTTLLLEQVEQAGL